MSLVFLESTYLWLFLVLPLFWFFPRKSPDWRHALIRCLVVGLLVAALARPALLKSQAETYQVVIWDRSESISEDAQTSVKEAVRAFLAKQTGTSRARLIVLNGTSEEMPSAIEGNEPLVIPGSSLSAALTSAARHIPEGALAAVTVISDGNSTDTSWGDAVRELADRRIPVHTIDAGVLPSDLYPTAIRTPHPVRAGQTSKVLVDVAGNAAHTITLSTRETTLATVAAETKQAGASVLARSTGLEFEPTESGFLEVEATVTATDPTEDSNPGNNRFRSIIPVQDPIRALYLSERLTSSGEKMTDLLGKGIDLDQPSKADLEQLAKNPETISAYDLVVIDDRPSESIPFAVQEAIVGAVKNEGVGLFYSGGKSVFGTGGYFDSPIASILPLEMIQKEEKRDPSTTLVVIIDTSGSMGGERVQLAKECARLAIRRLLPHDKVGIVEFYGTKQWAAPIQSAANAIDIQRAINRLDAGGGTVILPAIEEAFYAMQNVQTRYKHVLVLTDGGVESGDFETLMRRMAGKGINVSTVLVGGETHSEFLVNMANWGKGHFYAASNRFSIPEVLLKQPSTSKIPPYRPGIWPVSLGGTTSWWGDIPKPESPTLSGYVETRLRPGAQNVIETQNEKHPILASWRYGLGRVTAMTTEPVGRGTDPLKNWKGYGAWLMRVLSRTSRELPQPFDFTIDRQSHGARVFARRLTAEPHLPGAERLLDEGGSESLDFAQRSPNLYVADLQAKSSEDIRLRAGAQGWSSSMTYVASPSWEAALPEQNVDPDNRVDLQLLAESTGGAYSPLESASTSIATPGGRGTAVELFKLWPWCLLVALLGYIADILYRRWPRSRAA